MKPTLLVLIGCIAFACSPLTKVPEKKCLDLTGLQSHVTFEVNSPRYSTYKRNYLIQIYEDDTRKKLIDNVLLPRKGDWSPPVTVQSKNCIIIFKDRTLTTYSQMAWEKQQGGTSMIESGGRTYYASTKRGAFFLSTPLIVSKDGSAGDGVRAVIN